MKNDDFRPTTLRMPGRKTEGSSTGPRGFTLVELLVVIAIIAMLITVILPAVQAMRNSARRAQCKNQLLQLIMAAQNYEMAHEHFPAGVTDPAPGPIRSVTKGHHHGWLIALLPYLDEGSIHRNIDFDASVYDQANQPVRELTIPKLICPLELTDDIDGRSNYAACHHGAEMPIDADNRGVFFLNSRIMIDEVRDGLAHTIFVGEKIIDADDLGWMSGTRATLRNTGSRLNSHRGLKQIARDSDDPIRSDHGYGGSFRGGGYGDDRYEDPDESEQDQDESDLAADDAAGTEEPVENGVDDNADKGNEAINEGSVATVASPVGETPRTDLTVGGYGSYHANGAHVAFGDGRIQFMSPQVDPRIYQLLGDRDDGTLLDTADYRE